MSWMERRDAVQYRNALEQHMIKSYTDGPKLNGKASASFYPNGSHADQNFLHLEDIVGDSLPGRSFRYCCSNERLIMKKKNFKWRNNLFNG